MASQNAMFCYRPDNTCYAILSTHEWEQLRKAGRLDAELKRRRDSGVVLQVTHPETKAPVKHFKPREETRVVQAEAPAPVYRGASRDEVVAAAQEPRDTDGSILADARGEFDP